MDRFKDIAASLGGVGAGLSKALEEVLSQPSTSPISVDEKLLVSELKHTLGNMHVNNAEDLEKLGDRLLDLKNKAKNAM